LERYSAPRGGTCWIGTSTLRGCGDWRDAARQGEKWGQRKKWVSDAMESYYTQLRRDKRGAKQWVASGR
jgi:hypothetical protein